jgi:zinc protease
MTEKEIDKERGVIIEEWRTRVGSGDRLRKKTLPIELKGSKYVDRLPIGTLENLQQFTYASIRSFYKTWYRPDNMAMVVVGDFDPV